MAAVEGHSVVTWQGAAYAFGGKNKRDEYTDDVWQISIGPQAAAWKRIDTSGEKPTPRAYHGAVLWRDRYLIVIGGVGDGHTVTTSTVHVLDLEDRVWRTRETGGDVPQSRCHHSLNVSAHQDRLLLYGGYPVGPEAETMFASGHVEPQHRPFFEMYSLDLTGNDLQWQRLRCVEEFPPTLWGHTASLYFNNLVVFGGVDVVDNRESCLACVWHCDKSQWRWVEFNVVPQARALHSACIYRGCVLVFGGFGLTNTCRFNDTWSFSLESGQWVELAAGGELPSPRSGHASFMLDDQLVVVGGVDAEHRRLNDIHVLNLQAAQWRRLPVQVHGAAPIPSPEAPSFPESVPGIDKAQALLDRAAAQGAQYTDMERRHFGRETEGAPRISPPRHGVAGVAPAAAAPLQSQHPLPLRGGDASGLMMQPAAERPGPPRYLPPQPVYDKLLESVVPYSDPAPGRDNRHTSPMRGAHHIPPPPPPLGYDAVGLGGGAVAEPRKEVSFSQSVQTEAVGLPAPEVKVVPQPVQAVPQGDPGLEREAASVIQKQREEIDLLRSMLEGRQEQMRQQRPLEDMPQGGPAAPHISLTKETILDMMPKLLSTSITESPLMPFPPSNSAGVGKEGLISRTAIQDLVDRRIGSKQPPLSHSASPLLNPSLLSTAPTDLSRYTVQRRDTGPAPRLVPQQPIEAKRTSPERNRDAPLDILAHDPFRLFNMPVAAAASPGSDPALPKYHPSMYTPPASYADLVKKLSTEPQPSGLPPTNGVLPPAPSDPQQPGGGHSPPAHKAPSLAKILKGASMLSITHVQDPQERLPYQRPLAP